MIGSVFSRMFFMVAVQFVLASPVKEYKSFSTPVKGRRI